jgi:hypothetical protein
MLITCAPEVEMNAGLSRLNRIRALLVFFMFGLVVSGLSAVPLQWELGIVYRWLGPGSRMDDLVPALALWVGRIHQGVRDGYGQYPFLAYGTDWLAFGHVVIAIAFVGPLRDPSRNLWVVEFGMCVCLLVIPWTLVFGPLRGIPFFWMLIDMSFGVLGIVPLWFARRDILRLPEQL